MGLINRIFGRGEEVKIPKKLRNLKDKDRINLSYRGTSYGDTKLPTYDIVAINKKGAGQTYLGIVRVDADHDRERYTVFYSFEGQNRVNVETKENLTEASAIAYKTAHELAQTIARKNKLQLEDLTLEQETKEEDEKLKRQIDSLRHHYVLPLFFTFLMVIGLVISLSSFSATGNVVSSLIAPPGLIGISLFILGLAGTFFNLSKT